MTARSKMERETLEALLGQGLSVENIAKRFGKHPSTVSYWMGKYELLAIGRETHASRGGIERGKLEALIDAGMTIAEISLEVGFASSTVRYWLRRHGLRTKNKVGPRLGEKARAAKAAGRGRVLMECLEHGETEYVLEGRGYYRCKRCRSESIARRRRRLKQLLVDEAGGCCRLCGYAGSIAALEFHHLDPLEKRLGISAGGLSHSIDMLRAEVAKCVLLCSNCHAEVETGVRAVPVECYVQSRTGAIHHDPG